YQQGHNAPTLLNRNVPNPFYGILPQTTTLGAPQTTSALNLNRPYPLFNGIVQNTNPWAKYRYDALQLRFEKRFFGDRRITGALTIIFSYTSQNRSRRTIAWNPGISRSGPCTS